MSVGRWRGRGKIVAAIVGLALGATLTALSTPAQASFPGANGLIAYENTNAIFTINPNSPIPQALTQQADFNNPNFNATANLLVAEIGAGLVTLPPTVGAAVTVVPGSQSGDTEPSFFPSGTKVAFDDGTDVFSQDLTGANRTNLTAAIADDADDPDVSPNGAFIAFENQTTDQISRIDATGGGFIPALTPAAAACAAATECDAPSWSPNNQFVSYDQEGANNGIYQVLGSGASANPIRLTTGNDDDPAYAPDGTRVAFQDGNSQLATVPSDGSQATSSLNVDASSPTWGVGAAVVPPGSPTPTPTPAVVSISLASETKTSCSLALTVVPANATGVTADIVRTKRDGSTVLVQDNAAVPGTVTVDKKRKKKTYSLASVQGGTGTGSVVCKKRK